MSKTVDYYFVPNSPWSYLGHARFAALAAVNQATVNVRPADLGRIFAVSGGLPLPKRARFRDFLDLPLNLQPQFFPVAADAASRLIIAVDAHDGADAAMQSSSPDVLGKYEANTQAAIDAGVFGAPTYCVDGELFWGQDRLDFLERKLIGA